MPLDLDALRARFPRGTPDDIRTPAFRRAAQAAFTGAGRRPFPYAGPPTFLALPFQQDLAGLDVALVGVPLDLGVTNRAGTRLGPRAVRMVERIGPYHHVHRIAPRVEIACADVGDVPFQSRWSLEQSHHDIEAFWTALRTAGVRPIGIGGDHSMTWPILRALGAGRPLGLIHIDAHADVSGDQEGTHRHHGAPFRQAVLDGVLDPLRTIQIGMRGSSEMLYEFSTEAGMTVVHAEEVDTLGIPRIVEMARRVVGDGPTYISFDIDSIDPAFAPGTGTPEVGGLTPREVQALLRGLTGLDLVGGDVVEVAPQYDTSTVTAQVAAQMAFEILALLALNKGRA